MRAPPLALLPLALALAGCLGAPASHAPAPEAPAPALVYACPGVAWASAPCLAPLAEGVASNEEPFVALDPRDPRIVAVGTNRRAAPADTAERSMLGELGVYVSDDGGQSWHRTAAPTPRFASATPVSPHRVGYAADPALLFDDVGRLHMAGLATPGDPWQYAALLGFAPDLDDGVRAYYVRSDDRGRTWGEAVLLHDQGVFQDREWIVLDPATGTLYVAWQNIPPPGDLDLRTVEAVWSTDHGTSWRTLDNASMARCYRAGQPVVHEGRLLVACSAGEEQHLEVWALDEAAVRMVPVAALEVRGALPALAALPGGLLAMASDPCFVQDCEAVVSEVRWSRDGGASWGPAASMAALLPEWPHARIMWAAPGPDGLLHVLVATERRAAGPVQAEPVAWSVRHLALAESGGARHQAVLDAWTGEDEPARVSFGDHFFELAWAGHEGFLAFTRYPELRVGRVGLAP